MENICLRQYQFSHVDFHVVGCCNTLIGLRLPLHNEIAGLWNKVSCYVISISEAPADSVFMIENRLLWTWRQYFLLFNDIKRVLFA
jgi:hypothetical protein